MVDTFLKRFALGNERASFEVSEGHVVWRDHAGARATFNGHVADGHAAVHGKGTNRFAAIFRDVAGAAADPDFADDGEDDVFRGHAFGALAIYHDVHRLGATLYEALRGQHVFHFAGADTESQRAERAVCGRMAIAADDGLAGLGDAQFGADDVHDALILAMHVEEAHAKFLAIFFQGFEL